MIIQNSLKSKGSKKNPNYKYAVLLSNDDTNTCIIYQHRQLKGI